LDVLFNGTEGSFFVVDFVEMKNAYLRAVESAEKELEQLRTLVRELQSEIHRLEKLVNYGQ
jgi:hypothetical protein